MAEIYEDLFRIADRFDLIAKEIDNPEIKNPLEKLEEAAKQVGQSWSGSWLGYHSRVYYRNLQHPPPNARFSSEWGLMDQSFINATVGDWVEHDCDQVQSRVFDIAGNHDLMAVEEIADSARRSFDDDRNEVISVLSTALEERNDPFLGRLKLEAEKLEIFHASDFINYWQPSGKFMTRDTITIGQGVQTPPHISVLADVMALQQPSDSYSKLVKIARGAASHLEKRDRYAKRNREIGTKVFIGHGRSNIWRDLKDFIQDRLGLPWDEFNRVPVAGITNIARLSQMLDDAAIAFIVMTSEDEQADGKMHARLNVIHEAGLFQGRLDFTKAIVLIEEGCEEFSNINGLGQIRFPKGNIKAEFEQIRQVLEREGILNI